MKTPGQGLGQGVRQGKQGLGPFTALYQAMNDGFGFGSGSGGGIDGDGGSKRVGPWH